jgi:MFS family permease
MSLNAKARTENAKFKVALLVAGTYFMENLDSTVIIPAIPRMALDFGIAPIDLNIGVSSYLLTLGVVIPVSGWIVDRFGARRVFSFAILFFTIASLFCGLARSLEQFVAFRALQRYWRCIDDTAPQWSCYRRASIPR